MSNWSPVPRRPLLNEGMFKFDEEVQVVKKSISDIERQRSADGTPITRTPPSALVPAGQALVLESVNKSLEDEKKNKAEKKAKNKIDPAEVIKSYLAL